MAAGPFGNYDYRIPSRINVRREDVSALVGASSKLVARKEDDEGTKPWSMDTMTLPIALGVSYVFIRERAIVAC